MNPFTLNTVKYIVDKLAGTIYEPYVNFLLFCLLFAAVLKAFQFVIVKDSINAMRSVGAQVKTFANKRSIYGPEWEHFRERKEPYVSFAINLFLAFCCALTALVIAIVLGYFGAKSPFAVVALGVVWMFISFVYMRFLFAAASWDYHRIKNLGADD